MNKDTFYSEFADEILKPIARLKNACVKCNYHRGCPTAERIVDVLDKIEPFMRKHLKED